MNPAPPVTTTRRFGVLTAPDGTPPRLPTGGSVPYKGLHGGGTAGFRATPEDGASPRRSLAVRPGGAQRHPQGPPVALRERACPAVDRDPGTPGRRPRRLGGQPPRRPAGHRRGVLQRPVPPAHPGLHR